jgi:apolipoprotein N-acyltransferase
MSRAMLEKTEPIQTAPPAPMLRWYAKAGLLLLSVILLSFSFAPYKQFYLAWIGIVPVLIGIANTRSAWSAFFWTWIAGVAFFTANMWWLVFVTGPGLVALVVLLGMYWAVPAMILRGLGILGPPADRQTSAAARMLAIAAVWVGFEWLRGTWPLNGLPWLFLGDTQSPALLICQIADLFGVAGISFLVVMLNALIATAILDRGIGRLRLAMGIVVASAAFTVFYGAWRFSQESAATTPGPRVLVVQANVPQDNGVKGESSEQLLDYHVRATAESLESDRRQDLVVWSETMAPPVNPEVLAFVAKRYPVNSFGQASDLIGQLARIYHVNLLTGSLRWTGLSWNGDEDVKAEDRRNVTYLFNRAGKLAGRYDKVHLVPFGEYMPFEHTLPFAYRLMLKLSPYPSDYTLTAGDPDALTAFEIQGNAGQSWKFVSPICFEDIDGPMVAKMFRSTEAGGGKRAQFIVNVTNDGWFRAGENSQHLQASIFRAIENRAPIARSVNTGISGFVDSMGRPNDLIAAETQGTASEQLRIDSRVTFYTRFGDLFAILCAVVTGLLMVMGVSRWAIDKRRGSQLVSA